MLKDSCGVQWHWCLNDLESVSIEEYRYVKMYSSMEMEYKCEVVNSQNVLEYVH